jgi:hypothetical protein
MAQRTLLLVHASTVRTWWSAPAHRALANVTCHLGQAPFTALGGEDPDRPGGHWLANVFYRSLLPQRAQQLVKDGLLAYEDVQPLRRSSIC